ncbi:uncharacterized protein LOC122633965 isoform X2 [Vespula pensylvanica]|uniref:uncharacterized protein LOC122633965 isoform X2 n=1 Tax=Vespula pensylvanica TaxID=30213 RepID=UPI001CBA061B|nr:uncharacterized protein LOC122633965 isoform X2 [Vespula pensylvanica]
MANIIMDTFTTITQKDFIWPNPKPLLAKPAQPPMDTGIRLYLHRPKEEDCKCDVHGFQTDKKRYVQLANKERRLQGELIAVNHEMANLTTTLLNSTCETDDETMKSLYEIDYEKRELPIAHYRTLMAAVDSPIGAPIKPAITDLRDAYRDPTRFRYSAIERPTIEPAKTINLLTEEDWQIDPRLASIPTKFDEAAERLVHKQILDNTRTIYQVSYKDPWSIHKEEELKKKDEETEKSKTSKEISFQSELFTYIKKLYFNPHDEKVLAPPTTSKRIFGYSRPKYLHGSLSMYQDTHGRTGGLIMLHNVEFFSDVKERELMKKKRLKMDEKETDFCKEIL